MKLVNSDKLSKNLSIFNNLKFNYNYLDWVHKHSLWKYIFMSKWNICDHFHFHFELHDRRNKEKWNKQKFIYHEQMSQTINLDRVIFLAQIVPLYKSSTSFSFCLKMFLSSPRVDSIFSRENCCSPSAPLSFATQELSSLTVLSSSFHSLTSVSTFLSHSSETDLTFSYLSLNSLTSTSAS